jgi:hypothetical protein
MTVLKNETRPQCILSTSLTIGWQNMLHLMRTFLRGLDGMYLVIVRKRLHTLISV